MGLEVLVSCMNQDDYSIINKLNIKTDVVIINQNSKNSYIEENLNNNSVKFICCNQKGLTKSRNLALSYASNEICIFCDDDVIYNNNHKDIILKAFQDIPDADIIIFDIERINYNRLLKPIKKIRKAPRYKSYGSVRIAFKRKSLEQKNIWFDNNFGSGSIYSSGEESILLRKAHMKKLNIYEYPAIIARVDFKQSTWREGYNEKFFYDKGAMLSEIYPNLKYLFMFYYVISFKKSSHLKIANILKWIIKGIRGYKHLESYIDYINLNE